MGGGEVEMKYPRAGKSHFSPFLQNKSDQMVLSDYWLINERDIVPIVAFIITCV